MRRTAVRLGIGIAIAHGGIIMVASAQDDIGVAREHYNAGRFDEATVAATRLWQRSRSSAAAVVLARARLEQFRNSGDRSDLDAARELLRGIDPRALAPTERTEWELGLAGALYLSGDFGPAAEILDRLLREGTAVDADRDRLVDWWANAVDRVVQVLPRGERVRQYERLFDRLGEELGQRPESVAAAYWVVAAARGAGDAARAWNLAVAGWVRAGPGDETLRGDLDRLVLQGVIPDLAVANSAGPADAHVVVEAMAEFARRWQAITTQWAPH